MLSAFCELFKMLTISVLFVGRQLSVCVNGLPRFSRNPAHQEKIAIRSIAQVGRW